MNQTIAVKKWQAGFFLGLASLCIAIGSQTASADTIDLTALGKITKQVTTQEASAAASKVAETATAKAQAALATNMISEVTIEYTTNTYPAGQCTWGAKVMAPWVGNNWGNGGDWATSAAAADFEVGTRPRVGAIAVWSDGGYGHVAYVTGVAADGKIQVMESNYSGAYEPANVRGFFDPTTTSEGTVSYIYPPASTL